jgi:hypothetical protein
VGVHRLEVVHTGVAAIREQQPIAEGGRIREKRSFRVRVGRDRDAADLIGEATVRRVDFDGRRFDRREAPGEGDRQGGLSANDDPSWITMSAKRATAVCPSGVSVCSRN